VLIYRVGTWYNETSLNSTPISNGNKTLYNYLRLYTELLYEHTYYDDGHLLSVPVVAEVKRYMYPGYSKHVSALRCVFFFTASLSVWHWRKNRDIH